VKTIVVVPTYNERENVAALVGALHDVDPALGVLIVDDASPDGTGEIADGLAADDARVEVLHRTGPRGLGRAYREGFARALDAGADVVVQMDCDFSHDPASVPRLLAALENADLVLGSRYCRGGGTRNWGLGRRLLSRGGSLYARLWLGVPASDLTGGFKAWRRDLLLRLRLDRVRSDGYGFQVETTYRAHRLRARIREVPIVFTDRRVGESKMSGAIFREAVLMVPRLALGLIR
jgi:dolichol-phosphate mannosyltransferase